MIGKTISHYRIIEKLGAGGMGVVYKAQDLKLDRPVALKFLPHHMGQWEEDSERLAHERFVQEAKAASALDHPNIANIHEIDETADGQTFIVMSYYEGETLKKKIARGPLRVKEAVDLTRQVAEGLAKAHERGIVHRDIKPANIMITTDGVAKIIDFGLAKLSDATRITKRGAAVGTVAYMSPEQAKGEDIDPGTDIWSLGAVLYEMLTGEIPFSGPSDAAVIQAILNESPKPALELRKDAPEELGQIVARSLQKDRKKRYASIHDFIGVLTDLQIRWTPRPNAPATAEHWREFIRRPAVVIPALFVVLALGFLGWRYLEYQDNIRWAREEALPEIYTLVEEGDYSAAFDLARRAEPYIENDPMLAEAWPQFSREISIETSPPDADVYFKDYGNPDGEWEALGTTPLDNVRIPIGFFRWKVEKEGFEKREAADAGSSGSLRFLLDEEGSVPPGMVHVPEGAVFPYAVRARLEPLQMEDFFIDRCEVTNRRFKDFVDAGGYQDSRYWKQEFVKNGRVLSWQEAMEMFRDRTGRPGPATWEIGVYPDGHEDFPVTGVSWYEAAAYAEYAGGSLPTLYHWLRASNPGLGSYITPSSNFSSDGPAPVGSYPGMGPYGTYDLVGNVEEWCWNETEDKRYIMGGSFQNPSYMFSIPQIQSPWDRSASNGFRCIQSRESRAEAMSPIPLESRDYSKETPVSDETFEIYRRLYAYDKTPLHPKIESREESKYWTKEKIAFDAAYGDERMAAFLFLPKNSSPPFQTVVYFPGASALSLRSSRNLRQMGIVTFLVRSGRSVLYPIYKSTYERGDGFNQVVERPTMTAWRDHVIFWVKDLARSIDYLETRQDTDTSRIAYYGASWGADIGAVCLALETRIKAGVLALGGFLHLEDLRTIPEADQINFAPRITIPILMMNGRFDSVKPVESCQIPMFRFLGTPDEHRRHLIYETGHFLPEHEPIKETLDWLDRYLGPVGDSPEK